MHGEFFYEQYLVLILACTLYSFNGVVMICTEAIIVYRDEVT